MAKLRIQKLLGPSGVASRRAVEEMVLQGRITVNGEMVTKLPCFVEPTDEILVDGQPVRKRVEPKVYYLLNKPRGVICTQRDEPGRSRPRAADVLGPTGERVYCVGRLDADSTGIILLTNDGELTNRLTHARYGVGKTYIARVDGRLSGEEIDSLKRGIYMAGRRTAPAAVTILRRTEQETLLELRISEGRNRQVRRMLAALGHNVRRLHRQAIGPVTDRGLKIGQHRRLTPGELAALRRATGKR